MSYYTEQRDELAAVLAGEPADHTTAPSPDAVKALPALVIGPGANWLDGSNESGPGRVVRYELAVDVIVNAQEPIGAMVDLESSIELVTTRLPAEWRFERAEPPHRESSRQGELVTLTARLTVSRKHSIKGG